MHRFALFLGSFAALVGCNGDPAAPPDAALPPTTVGLAADAPGQFRLPVGLTVDEEGNAFVADRDNHRIQKLAPDGRVLDIWDLDFGVAYVAVASSGQVVAAGGETLALLDSRGAVIWRRTVEDTPKVAIAPDGTLATMTLVRRLSPLTRTVATFTAGGALITFWDVPLARALAFDPNGVLHVISGSGDVGYQCREYSVTGEVGNVRSLETDEVLGRRMEFTRSLDLDSEGNTYVAATNQLVIFDSGGSPSELMEIPWADGRVISSIGLDEERHEIVAAIQPREVVRGRIADGTIHGTWRLGDRTGPGVFWKPRGLAVGPAGRIAVADGGNGRIVLFDDQGRYQTSVPSEAPVLAFDDQGHLITGGYRLERYDELQPAEEWSLIGTGGLHGPEVYEIVVWEELIYSLVNRCSVQRAEVGQPIEQVLLCGGDPEERILAMALSPEGSLVVLQQPGVLRSHDLDGTLLEESEFALDNVIDMDFDRAGNLYVAMLDGSAGTVLQVSRTGEVLRFVEIPELGRLVRFTIGPDDALYALDAWREVVHRVEL